MPNDRYRWALASVEFDPIEVQADLIGREFDPIEVQADLIGR